jgi:hypothetical protein
MKRERKDRWRKKGIKVGLRKKEETWAETKTKENQRNKLKRRKQKPKGRKGRKMGHRSKEKRNEMDKKVKGKIYNKNDK